MLMNRQILEFYQMSRTGLLSIWSNCSYHHPYFILLNPKDIRPFWATGNCPLKIIHLMLNTQLFTWNDKTRIMNQIIPLKLSCWIPCIAQRHKAASQSLQKPNNPTWNVTRNLKVGSSPSRLYHYQKKCVVTTVPCYNNSLPTYTK